MGEGRDVRKEAGKEKKNSQNNMKVNNKREGGRNTWNKWEKWSDRRRRGREDKRRSDLTNRAFQGSFLCHFQGWEQLWREHQRGKQDVQKKKKKNRLHKKHSPGTRHACTCMCAESRRQSKVHLCSLNTLRPLSCCNWFMMYSLMCAERKGGKPSPFRETNARPQGAQWVRGRIIKIH